MCLFLLVTGLLATAVEGEDTNTTKSNISAITQAVVVEDYTNTVLYSVGVSATVTKVPLEGNPAEFTDSATYTRIVNYIPTLYKVLKAYSHTPVPTPYELVPEPTKALKYAVFKPGLMIGCTFGVVFVLGLIYTESCRRPRHVKPPPAVVKNTKDSSSSMSSLSGGKKKEAKNKKKAQSKKEIKTPGVQRARSGTASTKPKAAAPAKAKNNARSGHGAARPVSGRPAASKAKPASTRSQRPAQKRARK